MTRTKDLRLNDSLDRNRGATATATCHTNQKRLLHFHWSTSTEEPLTMSNSSDKDNTDDDDIVRQSPPREIEGEEKEQEEKSSQQTQQRRQQEQQPALKQEMALDEKSSGVHHEHDDPLYSKKNIALSECILEWTQSNAHDHSSEAFGKDSHEASLELNDGSAKMPTGIPRSTNPKVEDSKTLLVPVDGSASETQTITSGDVEDTVVETRPTSLESRDRLPVTPGAVRVQGISALNRSSATDDGNSGDRSEDWDNLMSVSQNIVTENNLQEDHPTNTSPIMALSREDMVHQETQNRRMDQAIVISAKQESSGEMQERYIWVAAFCTILLVVIAIAVPLVVLEDSNEDTSLRADFKGNVCWDPQLAQSDPLWTLLFEHTSSPDFYDCTGKVHPLNDRSSDQYRAYFRMRNWSTDSPRNKEEVLERYALTTFCLATGCLDQWGESQNWLSEEVSVCDWYSNFDIPNASPFSNLPFPTTCNERGQLATLAIDGATPAGTIPPELGLLTNLNVLALSHENMFGTLPSSLGRLTDLQHFSAAQSQFTGTLPELYGQWTNLIDIHLQDVPIEGAWPVTYSNWTQPQLVRLDHVIFDEVFPEEFCDMTYELILAGGGWMNGPSSPFRLFGLCGEICWCCTTCCELGSLACGPNTNHQYYTP